MRDYSAKSIGRGQSLRAFATALAILIGSAGLASAQSKHAAMVIDANSGETLHADKADEPRYPASLTKMMTLYMVFEQLELGRLTPSTKIKVSQEAASAQPTKLDLEPGEQIAVIDAIKALITKSANDMAIALAEAVGGSEAKFAELMTAKARSIGMRNTTFRNASGLPDPGQVTTARDMLTLALHLQDDFPKYFPLFALRSFTYNGSSYRNHNTMLNSFEGIDGIKTGYTRMSGFNLVTSLHRGDKHLVGAVFGGTTAGTRNLTMRMLLTRSLLKASTKKTRKPAPVLVARAKPATRPETRPEPAKTVAAIAPAKPKPQIVANPKSQKPVPSQPPQPNSSSTAPALVAPEPIQLASTAPEPAAEPAPAEAPAAVQPATPIEIAKVRPVMVAPRIKRTAFVIAPEPEIQAEPNPVPEQTPAVAAAMAALSEPLPVRQAPAPQVEAIVPPIVVTRPPAAAPEARPVAAPRQTIAAPSRPVAPAVAAPPQQAAVTPQRGAMPSTLQAQAQSLGRGVPTSAPMAPQQVAFATTTPSHLRGPVPTAPVAGPSGFHIQIGAYASATEAERVLRDTQARASGLLKAATPVTAPVQKENRLLYRARFAGFSAQTAANTCLELRRTAIDCFVMKAE